MKVLNGVHVPETDEDLAQRAIDDAAWGAGAALREVQRVETASGLARWQRDLLIASNLPGNHPAKKRATDAEAAIAALGVRQN